MSKLRLIEGPVSFLKKYKYILIVLFLAVIIRLAWLKITLASDEGELGYDAMLWLRGQMPYTMRFSGEPPLVYLTYMAFITLFGNTIMPIRVFNDVLFFISIIGLYFIVKSWFGAKTGLMAALFYAFLLNAPAFWGQLAVPIQLALSLSVLSVLACNSYVESKKVAYLVASGILLSAAGLMHWGSFAIVFLLLILLVSNRRDRPIGIRRISGSLFGSILVMVGSILVLPILFTTYFLSTGVLSKMIQNVLVRQVTETGPQLGSWNVPFGWIFTGLMEGLPILIFGLLGVFVCFLVRKRQYLYVISWLLIPLPLFFALEPHDSYHFSVIAPAASILSALGLSFLFNEFSSRARHKFLPNKSRRKVQIFTIGLLIVLVSTSAYFQILQFPNGTIRWNFVDWQYSNIGSYDQITQLTTYLKALNVTDGGVLVQDWLPYVYWMTGIRAPSIHLNTLQIGDLGIPSDEYQKLLTEVKDKKIPFVVINSNVPEGADAITDFVRAEYFPLKSIGGVDIYVSPNTNQVFFSFVAELQDARAYGLLPNGTEIPLEELNNWLTPIIERVTVNDETQYAIRQQPLVTQSNMTYSNIQIPNNASLEFSVAINPAAWTEPGDGVFFKIGIQNNGQSAEVFSRYIDPKHFEVDRKWFQFDVSLAEYAGKTVNISFITNPGTANDSRWDWAEWGNPLLLNN